MRIIIILAFLSIFYSCNEVNYTQGQRIYNANCSNCHMEDGSGLKNLIPSLDKNPLITEIDSKVIAIIHYGVNADSLGKTDKYMPAHKKMSDVEMTNLLNFLQERFNPPGYEFKLDEVKKTRGLIIKKMEN
jgi:mono/diheme cytochrome c family protein